MNPSGFQLRTFILCFMLKRLAALGSSALLETSSFLTITCFTAGLSGSFTRMDLYASMLHTHTHTAPRFSLRLPFLQSANSWGNLCVPTYKAACGLRLRSRSVPRWFSGTFQDCSCSLGCCSSPGRSWLELRSGDSRGRQ